MIWLRFTVGALLVLWTAVAFGYRSAEDVRIDDEIRFTQKSEMKWVDRRLSDLEERIKRLEAMVGGSDDKGRR